MDEFAKGGKVADRLHQFDGDIDRMGSHEADPLHARNFIQPVEEVVEEAVPFRFVFAVAIDILAEESDLFIPLFDEFRGILRRCFRGGGNLLAARIGDDAIGAEFIAAADDRDIGFDLVVPLGDQIIEIFFELIVGFEDVAALYRALRRRRCRDR